jgi:hypothetical protein
MNIQYFVRLLKFTGYSEDEVQIWVQKKDDEHHGRLYKVPTLIEGILHLLSEEGEVLEIGQTAQWSRREAMHDINEFGRGYGHAPAFNITIRKDDSGRLSVRLMAPVLKGVFHTTPDDSIPVELDDVQLPQMIRDCGESLTDDCGTWVDMGEEIRTYASLR